MRLIDADAIRIKPEFMENICGIAMIRAEDLARILIEQPIVLNNEDLELLKEYKAIKPLIDDISEQVHETASIFRKGEQ